MQRAGDNSVLVSRRRGLAAFAGVAAGYLIADAAAPIASAYWFCAGLALLAVCAAARAGVARVAAVFAIVALAGGWFTLRIHERPTRSFERFIEGAGGSSRDGVIVTLDAMLVDDPRPVSRDAQGLDRFIVRGKSQAFQVSARTLHDAGTQTPVEGFVRVIVAEEAPVPARAGDWVRVTGVARGVPVARNPGRHDARRFAAQDGLVGTLHLSRAELVVPLAGAGSVGERLQSSWRRTRAWMQARARRVIDRAFPEESREKSLVEGLLLGDMAHAAPELRSAFARLGLAHALSISGFHLAVMAAVTLSLVRLTGDRGWVEPVIVGVLVIAYSLIVPASSPIVRSAAMVVLLLLGEAMGRRYDRLTLLIWIASALLVWRPVDLWSLGYQLTFGLTGLLFWLGGVFHARLFRPEVRTDLGEPAAGPLKRLVHAVLASVSSSVLCCAASVPLVLFRTGIVSPIAVVATVVVTPVIVAILWVGYAALLVGFVVPGLGGAAGVVLWGLAHGAVMMSEWLSAIPMAAVRPPPVSVAWTLAATAALILLLRAGSPRRAWGWALLAGTTLWLGGEWWLGGRLSRGVTLRADMLSVGDGTCVLVRSGRDAMLWDVGSLTSGLGRAEIPGAVRALGAWRVPVVVVSHPDIDHFGALPEVVDALGVRVVYVGERLMVQAGAKPEGSAAFLLNDLARRRVAVRTLRAGEEIRLGSCVGTVLSPPNDADWSEDNDHSLVLRVTDGEGSLLLTGDIQTHAIASLRRAHPALRATILELPHHGSVNPMSTEWVLDMAPSVVLQSTGPRRADDPRWALARSGREWLVTARRGAVYAELLRGGGVRSGAWREGNDVPDATPDRAWPGDATAPGTEGSGP